MPRPLPATTRPAPADHVHAVHAYHGSQAHGALNADAHIHAAAGDRVIRLAPSVIRLGVGMRLAGAALMTAGLWALTLSVVG